MITRTNSPKHCKRKGGNKLRAKRRRFVSREQILEALELESRRLEGAADRLIDDLAVLDDVGLGSTGRAEALRRILTEHDAHRDQLLHVATDMKDCGRVFLQEECLNGHVRHKPFYCNKPLCPECAARIARRKAQIYTARVASRLFRAPRGVRARAVTLPLRPHDTETFRDMFNRCRPAVMETLRLCFGVPHKAAEWRRYFELEPITDKELARVPETTRGGRRRSRSTRLKMAKAHRRRAVKMQPARRAFGAVVSVEFGETGSLAHGHALVVGRYVDQRTLSKAWQLVTGGTSYIAHIQEVKDIRAGAVEVLKYMAKFGAHTAGQLVELYRSTLGTSTTENGAVVCRQRRRTEPLGTLRGKLAEEDTPAPCCSECGASMHVVGSIPWSLWITGVRDVPEERRFRRRPREPD